MAIRIRPLLKKDDWPSLVLLLDSMSAEERQWSEPAALAEELADKCRELEQVCAKSRAEPGVSSILGWELAGTY